MPAGAAHEEAAPVGGRIWNRFTAGLAALVLVMCAVLAMRFIRGIGAVTNLNDGYPWGLWIAYDVVVGSALAAGGFTVAFLTYILNRGEYHPAVRPALLAALFGYVQAGMSVFFDIGRYWEFWHMFWPRYVQVNSVLFEVSLCITTYTLVLFVEFTPVILERFGWERPRQKINRVLFFFVAVGVLLPTMHQSSLGSLLVIFGPQVHPLYQTQLLPLLFLTSCIGMGLAAVVFEGTVSALAFKRHLEQELLGKLIRIGTTLGLAFLVLRIGDCARRGVLGLAFQPTALSLLFWIENVLFLVPALLVATERARRHPQRLFVAACLLAVGGLLYRRSAYLVAYETGAGFRYFPSMGELAVSVGLVAFEILAITIAIRLLPVLPKEPEAAESA
ncbi:MAG: Ni/Fe-hydrogenase cytochrome b subunit [Deltaproteobacteria bacterium]|nr:Ni/Fe-hydrogenase cytochrome b subunit [Deltaproteobacteria bacterium]